MDQEKTAFVSKGYLSDPIYMKSGFPRRAPLATYRAHYADNYCHRMAATNALVIIVSKRANVFSAPASFVKNQIPE